MRVGVLTGGGDCPGLNAVIRAVVRRAIHTHGDKVIGFRDGWKGVLDQDFEPLDVHRMRGTLPRGGTVLGTSRVQPFMFEDGVARVRATLAEFDIEAIIAIGGEGTLGCARDIHDAGIPVVGVPKTIDNDIACTERTFGFDTAVHIASGAIDRLHTTAESHDRVMVVEVMGRHAGHIAVHAGIAGGASMTLIPEFPFDIGEVCAAVERRHAAGRYATIIVVAEGAQPVEGTLAVPTPEMDDFGHERLGGIGDLVAYEVERRTGFESRVTRLGYVQRGGTPTAYDRVLSTRYGIAAIDAVHAGDFGSIVALQCDRIVLVPLADATRELKLVDPELWAVAREFFP